MIICHSLIHFGDGFIYRKEEDEEINTDKLLKILNFALNVLIEIKRFIQT